MEMLVLTSRLSGHQAPVAFALSVLKKVELWWVCAGPCWGSYDHSELLIFLSVSFHICKMAVMTAPSSGACCEDCVGYVCEEAGTA